LSPPLVVERWRGPRLESSHVVHAVVVTGDDVRAWGDGDRLTFPRSAVKPLQALPLVRTGAADAFELSARELALACASHNGEAGHIDTVSQWLRRIGCRDHDLECGIQADRAPVAVANNCSGKHTGFLTIARFLDVDPHGYVRADHPVMRTVLHELAAWLGPLGDAGIDGCGIPAPAVPLAALARSAAGFGGSDEPAVARVRDAMFAEPWFVAGSGRLCTELLATGEVIAKVGAEGVQWAAVPAKDVGIAVKVEDGSRLASEAALGHLLAALGLPLPEVFGPRSVVHNHAGTEVGHLRVA
jgi:L-asparaginase II